MEQTTLMTEVQRISHRCHDFTDVLFRHAERIALSNQSTCVSTVYVFHRDPEPTVGLTAIENPNDMGVPERRGQFGLANESRPKLLVGRRGRRQDLQRVLTRQPRMLDEVNLTHPTGAEQPLDHVAGEFLTGVQRHVQEPTNQHRVGRVARFVMVQVCAR